MDLNQFSNHCIPILNQRLLRLQQFNRVNNLRKSINLFMSNSKKQKPGGSSEKTGCVKGKLLTAIYYYCLSITIQFHDLLFIN